VEKRIPESARARGITEEQVRRDVLLASQPAAMALADVVAVAVSPYRGADEIELPAEIPAALAHRQVHFQVETLPEAQVSFPGLG
jgi:hypothetical protein